MMGLNTAPVPPPGAHEKQGVVVMISGDKAMFIGCKFIGAQDTLYDNFGRHYYKNCYIEGYVDFIFGDGRSLFEPLVVEEYDEDLAIWASLQFDAYDLRDKVKIPLSKPFVTIERVGVDNTILQWGDIAGTRGPQGEKLGINRCATCTLDSTHFIAKNITFKNTTPVPPPGAHEKQGVAVMISGDKAMFLGCKFIGAQDTPVDKFDRHYYKNCYIEGSVDFIFGDERSLFEGCHIRSIAYNLGVITAQRKNSSSENKGLSFVESKIIGSGNIYFGRTWGPFSLVIFAYTYMENIIIPKAGMIGVTLIIIEFFITVDGVGADHTIVQWDDTTRTCRPKGEKLELIIVQPLLWTLPISLRKTRN
ncbi:hypothetical protein TanjilG_04496 [Lupinus angustifolius]|uniref:Pectinesterase n=1 Tax=Lupinus angustifolius TaxID=3871 RepID=A0A4P1RQQ5_LUPAN|nr:hypothetical protein TanjilG_04496 [Lupinus angustifolius]